MQDDSGRSLTFRDCVRSCFDTNLTEQRLDLTMGFWDSLRDLFSAGSPRNEKGVDELARRLDLSAERLRSVRLAYRKFSIPKRDGRPRFILEPGEALKNIQRLILRRLLQCLRAHDAANGFERRKSIVTNALPHVGQAVVLRMDVKDFFSSTTAERINLYFRNIGWDQEAAQLLTQLCTYEGKLPQGAPTSPRLSNLVNGLLDARLAALAKKFGASYTRYADDLTFSFAADDRDHIRSIIRATKLILEEEGYRLHTDKKLRIHRRHNRQTITGLVVNERVRLPRRTRRWLRAIEHHAANGRAMTLTPAQLAGWRAFQEMIARQANTSSPRG